MPYNKGDFTQQGIAGDVTSLVRLNEKRTVKLTLSTDDASDNCDISGSVIDELNGKTYPIGAGVSGNIEITENGENINVAPYATATVNVAGEIPYIIPPQTVTTLSSGYRELPLGANLESLSLGDHAVLKVSGSYYGVPISGYIIGSVMDLTPGDEAITFAGNFGSNDDPMTVQVDVMNTPGFGEYEWGILLLLNNTQTAITDLEVSAVAW